MKDNKGLFKYIRKLCLYALPVLVVAVLYVMADPFKVIWHYERYFDDNVPHVGLNMDFVSTENFVNRNPEQNYNAFIFGNSRSQYWRVDDWKKHIGGDARCYHYYGNGETLYALEKNIKFIDRSGNKIDHALLIVDAGLLSQVEAPSGHLFCTPPRTERYRNIAGFHATNFMAFLHPDFIYTYLDLKLNRQLKPYMLEKFLVEQPVVYHPNSNEIVDQMFDRAIADGTYYTDKRMLRFQDRQHPDSISPRVLKEENIRLLGEVARILQKHHTDCKVVINPLYDQIKFNPADLQVLRDIFGKAHVFDFSGKNAITSDYRNYYEESHYRPVIASRLMDSIYALGQ